MQNGCGLTQSRRGPKICTSFACNYIFSPPNLQYLPTPMKGGRLMMTYATICGLLDCILLKSRPSTQRVSWCLGDLNEVNTQTLIFITAKGRSAAKTGLSCFIG